MSIQYQLFLGYSSVPNKRCAIFIVFWQKFMHNFIFYCAIFINFKKSWVRNFYLIALHLLIKGKSCYEKLPLTKIASTDWLLQTLATVYAELGCPCCWILPYMVEFHAQLLFKIALFLLNFLNSTCATFNRCTTFIKISQLWPRYFY